MSWLHNSVSHKGRHDTVTSLVRKLEELGISVLQLMLNHYHNQSKLRGKTGPAKESICIAATEKWKNNRPDKNKLPVPRKQAIP